MTAPFTIQPLAPEDRPAILAMAQTYMAEIAPSLAPFPPEKIARYWQAPDRFAFTFHQGALIGFALITKRPQCHELSEFYIAPAARSRGFGRRAALGVIGRFPGRWQLGLASGTPAAKAFWPKALSDLPVKRGPPLTPHQSGSLHFFVKETAHDPLPPV